MNFKDLKNKIKQEQKQLAQDIKTCKPLRKPSNWEAASDEIRQLRQRTSSWEYRHRHIIYCQMFNNTPYELIEQPRDNNRPSSHYLKKIRKEWEEQLDEVISDCA